MNLNQLAIEICKRESGKRVLNNADVKEVLRCLGDIIYFEKLTDVDEILRLLWKNADKRHKKK